MSAKAKGDSKWWRFLGLVYGGILVILTKFVGQFGIKIWIRERICDNVILPDLFEFCWIFFLDKSLIHLIE